jgi:hypothetical protein
MAVVLHPFQSEVSFLVFLCAFLPIAKSAYYLSNVSPSVHIHLHGSHRLDFCELILGAFIKICQGTPDLVKIGQQYWVY